MKLFLRPLAIVFVPQAIALVFYGLLRIVWGNGDVPRIAYTVAAVLALLLGCCWGMFDCVDNVLPAHERRKELQERERAELRRKIDREIGIPR